MMPRQLCANACVKFGFMLDSSLINCSLLAKMQKRLFTAGGVGQWVIYKFRRGIVCTSHLLVYPIFGYLSNSISHFLMQGDGHE